MNKKIYKSKTIWGFGVVALGILATEFGIIDPSTTVSVIETLAASLGIYGLRDSIS